MMRRSARMLPAALAAGSITLVLSALVGLPSASADEIARMEIVPASGTLDTPMDLHIGVPCPAEAPNALVVLTGPGLSPQGENLVGNTENTAFEVDSSGTVIVPLIYPLDQVQQMLPAGKRFNGDYRITMICRQPLDATSMGEFSAFLRINGKKQTYTELPDGADVALPEAPTMLPQVADQQGADSQTANGGAEAGADPATDAVADASAAPAGGGAEGGSAGGDGGGSTDTSAEDPAVTALANTSADAPQAAQESTGTSFPIAYLLILVGALLIGGGAMAMVRRRSS